MILCLCLWCLDSVVLCCSALPCLELNWIVLNQPALSLALPLPCLAPYLIWPLTRLLTLLVSCPLPCPPSPCLSFLPCPLARQVEPGAHMLTATAHCPRKEVINTGVMYIIMGSNLKSRKEEVMNYDIHYHNVCVCILYIHIPLPLPTALAKRS